MIFNLLEMFYYNMFYSNKNNVLKIITYTNNKKR